MAIGGRKGDTTPQSSQALYQLWKKAPLKRRRALPLGRFRRGQNGLVIIMVMEFESELVCSSDSDSDESSSDSCQEYDDDAFYPDVEESVSGYKIVDLQCLQELMDQFTVCRKCTKGDMIVSNCHDTGLGSTLRLQCALCGHSGSTSLSKKICRSYDLN